MRERTRLAAEFVFGVAAASLALHLFVLARTPYGVHRDEFLYMSMGRHLRLWHMDFPPAIAILANISRAMFHDSLASVRVFPAIEGTILIVVTALIARELGGRWFAQLLAMLSVLAAPLYLRAATLFQPVVLDQLWWTLALYALIRIGRAQEDEEPEMSRKASRKWWLWFGVACGLGLLTKFSIGFFAVATLLALLVTPLRRSLATPWPWIAAAIMLVVGSPSIGGQLTLHFPVLQQMRDLQAQQLEHVTYASFFSAHLLMLAPSPCSSQLSAWPHCCSGVRSGRTASSRGCAFSRS